MLLKLSNTVEDSGNPGGLLMGLLKENFLNAY